MFLLSGALSAGAATPCAGSVLAGSNFEIDTNANLKVDGPPDCIDWLSGGSGTGMRAGVITKNDLPTGSSDNSFGQGSQENDLNPTIVDGSIPPNKSDLKTFGLYTEGGTTPQFLELFWSRVQNPSGTTNMDFELNQKFCDPSATPTNCSTNGVTPVRTVGDKLITYNLSNGGTVATIEIRTWGIPTAGVWGPATDLTAAGEALGTVNTSAIAAADSGGIGSLSSFTFGEASISIAALFPNLGDLQCGTLGSAFVKSRSSDSFQAEIKDFIAPESVTISNCATPTLTTTASGPVVVGSKIHDVAHLSAGANPTGSITFKVYAPGDTTCQTPIDVPPVKTVAGNADYTSGDFTTTQTGVYRWRAFYSGDSKNNAVSTPCNDANESSTVNPDTPTLTTNASGPVIVGSKIHDVAHLSAGFAPLGGSISFKVYAPGDTACATPTAVTPDVPVSGANDYTSADFTTTQTGVYRWRAFYSGDSNNNPVSTPCNDANESSTVNPDTPTLTTNASGPVIVGQNIHDVAHLSAGFGTLGGQITFEVFAPGDTTCQTPISVPPAQPVSGANDYTSGDFATSVVGTYRWIAHYSGDANNNAVDTKCNDANESSTVNKVGPQLSTDAGPTVRLGANGVDLTDTATLAGATDDVTGTITFQLFSDANCETQVGSDVTTAVDHGNGQYSSPTVHVDTAGTYHWIANYGGDDKNGPTENGCNEENENVLVISPAISITKKPDTQTIRNGDTATWTITVTNTGDSTLTNVHVDDAQAPGCARTAAEIALIPSHLSSTFAPGESVSYDCSLANVTSDFTNTAVATGTDETEQDVTAEDSADVDVINPHVTILKSPDTQTIVSGQTATFTIQVINDGDSTLTNVVVTDALAPGCARTSADIGGLASMPPAPAAGSTITYQCTLANVTASFTNTAVATGKPPVGPDVSSQDTAGVTVVQPVTHPAVQIVKDPKSQTVTKGNTATFTITVLNTGDVALTDVVVTDALSPNCNKTIGTLAPGQSVSYKCTRPNVQSSFTNVAVVTGKAGGTTVTDQDTAPVTAKAPFVPKVVPKVVSHKKPKATG